MAGCLHRLPTLYRLHVLRSGSRISFVTRIQNSVICHGCIPFMDLHGCKSLPISQTFVTFVSSQRCVHIQKLHSVSHGTNVNAVQEEEIEELKGKFEAVSNKIIFNSVLECTKFKGNWKKRRVLEDKQEKLKVTKINKKDPRNNIPVALKYLTDTPEILAANENQVKNSQSENEIVCLPYSIETELDIAISSKDRQEQIGEDIDLPDQLALKSELGSSNWTQLSVTALSNPSVSNWMSDYECYDESGDMFENTKPWELNYGTPDVSIPISDVPCGGCGAVLHCQASFYNLLSVHFLCIDENVNFDFILY